MFSSTMEDRQTRKTPKTKQKTDRISIAFLSHFYRIAESNRAIRTPFGDEK